MRFPRILPSAIALALPSAPADPARAEGTNVDITVAAGNLGPQRNNLDETSG